MARTTTLTAEVKIAVGHASRISATLVLGGSLCLAAVVARLLGYDSIEISSIELPVNYVSIPVAALTVVHIFWSAFFLAELIDLSSKLSQVGRLYVSGELVIGGNEEARVTDEAVLASDFRQAVFHSVRTSEGLFLRGFLPRRPRGGSNRAYISAKDPTGWLAYGLAVLAIGAMLPWTLSDGRIGWESLRSVLTQGFIAATVVIINWVVGSTWAVSLSRFADNVFESESQADEGFDSLLRIFLYSLPVLVIGGSILVVTNWPNFWVLVAAFDLFVFTIVFAVVYFLKTGAKYWS